MKPCPCWRNRKWIAWLVLDTLEVERAAALRDHLQACEGCRQYFNELSALSRQLNAGEMKADLTPSPSFSRRVAVRIRATETGGMRYTAAELLRAALLKWRIAGPVGAACVAMVALLIVFSSKPHIVPPQAVAEKPAPPANFSSNLQPTVANYQMVADESLDKLDELLTQQGRRNLPRVPTYTASTGMAVGLLE